MAGEYGNDFITLTDEEGNEIELEHLHTLEHEGETYMAFIPADTDDEDETAELIILKVESVGEEDMLVTLESEELLETLFERFVEAIETEDEGEADFSDDEE